MYREKLKELELWKNSNDRKPLIIRGARQVGKTWIMQEFGNKNYEKVAYINFDGNERMERLFQGDFDIERLIEGLKIEYFEKPIIDLYESIENDFENRNVAWLSILGTSKIIFDKTGELKHLQECTINRFNEPLPKLDTETAKEYVSIINNRIEKLEKCLNDNSPNFIHLYHLTLEKIRKFYHSFNGLALVQTSKVYRVYTDKEYRESYSSYDIPEQEFVDMYLDAITDIDSSLEVKLEKVKNIFNYVKRDIDLGKEYRILIKSRNNQKDKNRYF